MSQTVLHFVFTASGAGCLVQAFRKAGRDDQVIASEDFSFGPIDPLLPHRALNGLRTPLAGPIGTTEAVHPTGCGTRRVFP
jgi:hypothetical protein